mgnify:FL=1
MKKQGLTVVISHADSTLGQRMTRILARHGAEMILLYQKFDPALRLAEKVYACGSDCVMISLDNEPYYELCKTMEALRTDDIARQFIYIH